MYTYSEEHNSLSLKINSEKSVIKLIFGFPEKYINCYRSLIIFPKN